jgi:hypothetical protein
MRKTNSTQVLAGGALVDVDERGRTSFIECGWLVQVPSGHPEPDFPSDEWLIVPCPLRRLSVDGSVDWTTCEAGHEHVTYGSEVWQAREAQEAYLEQVAAWESSRL